MLTKLKAYLIAQTVVWGSAKTSMPTVLCIIQRWTSSGCKLWRRAARNPSHRQKSMGKGWRSLVPSYLRQGDSNLLSPSEEEPEHETKLFSV